LESFELEVCRGFISLRIFLYAQYLYAARYSCPTYYLVDSHLDLSRVRRMFSTSKEGQAENEEREQARLCDELHGQRLAPYLAVSKVALEALQVWGGQTVCEK
jgi:hypothetical protein